MFDINSFTEIAIRIIPKNLRKTYTPPIPIIRCTRLRFFSTRNTIIIFTNNPIIMSCTGYSARIDNKAVNVAGPAISGNTIGTKVALPPGASFLNISTPNIISTEIIKMTKAPATANDETSTLNNCSTQSPINKKAVIMAKAYIAARSGSTFRPSLVKFRKIGTEPSMSINTKRTTNALSILVKLNGI